MGQPLGQSGAPRPVASRMVGVLLIGAHLVALGYLAVLAGLLWWANAPALAGWQPRVVLTGSMAPAVLPGDVVLVGPARPDPAHLRPGQIVLVHDQARATASYLHRLTRYDAGGRLITKGDANAQEDNPPVDAGRLAGRVRLVVPSVGRPAVWLHQHQLLPLALGVLCTGAAAATVLRRGPATHRASAHPRRRAVRTLPVAAGLLVVASAGWFGGTGAVFSAATGNTGDTFASGTWSSSTATGELFWWGAGGYAQNAVDSTSRWTMAVETTGATSWAQVSAGADHTCAVRTGGTMWCWGGNTFGQLGLGTTTSVSTPTQVGSLTTWSQVNAGGHHTCALRTDRTLWCWGLNNWGQLGNGNSTNQSTPVQVTSGSTTWLSVAAGTLHTCGITYPGSGTSGTVYCWGDNRNAQFGDGGTSGTATSTPSKSSGQSGGAANAYVSITAGTTHTCALDNARQLYCWGEGMFGQNGNSNYQWYKQPSLIGTDTDWASVVAGALHTCALKTTGTLWCMGLNSNGQLGLGDDTSRASLTQVGTSTWTALGAGGNTSCALTGGASPAGTAGSLWCWGSNAYGRYGRGDSIDRPVPYQAASGSWSSLAIGPVTACAISGGSLSCAGSDRYGALGRGSTVVDRAISGTALTTTVNWSALSPGRTFTCGIDSAAALWCWGSNGSGQLGLGTTATGTAPTRVGSGTWTAVTGGGNHGCGLQTGGTLWCWGSNARGQLGVGDTTARTTPTQVALPAGQAGGTTWTQVAAGRNHTCATLSTGTLWCWGANGTGQLGLGDQADRTSPAQVSVGVTTWTKLAPGSSHTCALQGNPGSLYCWGENLRGQLGNGNSAPNTPALTPTRVGNLSTWTAVAVGDWHTCGMQSASLMCWGDNTRGQTGNATFASPLQMSTTSTVTAPAGSWAQVTTGPMHTCALTTLRAVYCWGFNEAGQLGTGGVDAAFTPALAVSPLSAMGMAVGGNAMYVLIGNYAGTVVNDAPAGYWRLGEASGTTATAFTGTPNGTMSGAPTLGATGAISGDPDTAVTLAAASSQKIAFGDVDDFDARTAFSVEFWVKPTAAATATRQAVLAKERYVSDSNRGGWAVLLASTADASGAPGNSLVFGRYSGTGGDEITSTTQLSAGTWYHVVATYDGNTMRLLVNGSQERQAASTVNVENTTAALTIGALPTGNYLSGTVDEPAVYAQALSSTQVTAHYAARTG